jgi:hypothetical protein
MCNLTLSFLAYLKVIYTTIRHLRIMTDGGADKNNSYHVLSCVPGSLLGAGDTTVNKTAKNSSSQVQTSTQTA